MNDPGDEDDGEQKLEEALLAEYVPYLRALMRGERTYPTLTILSMDYRYSFGPRVKYPDHDLGDEDRRNNYFPIARPMGKWNPPRSNPPRPCR